MPTPKKTRSKFLHLHFDAREFLRVQSIKETTKSGKFVSQSKVADRVFSVLKKRPQLLKEVLKHAS